MSERTIYVVIGSAGQYEDYRTWPVAAFAFREKAERFAVNAYQWSAAALAHVRSLELEYDDRQRWDAQNLSPYDPNWEGREDAAYSVQEIPAAPTTTVVFTAKRFRRKHPREVA